MTDPQACSMVLHCKVSSFACHCHWSLGDRVALMESCGQPAGHSPAVCSPWKPCAAVLRTVLCLQGFRQLFVALFVMPEERKVSHWLGVVPVRDSDLPLSMPASLAGAPPRALQPAASSSSPLQVCTLQPPRCSHASVSALYTQPRTCWPWQPGWTGAEHACWPADVAQGAGFRDVQASCTQ